MTTAAQSITQSMHSLQVAGTLVTRYFGILLGTVRHWNMHVATLAKHGITAIRGILIKLQSEDALIVRLYPSRQQSNVSVRPWVVHFQENVLKLLAQAKQTRKSNSPVDDPTSLLYLWESTPHNKVDHNADRGLAMLCNVNGAFSCAPMRSHGASLKSFATIPRVASH